MVYFLLEVMRKLKGIGKDIVTIALISEENGDAK